MKSIKMLAALALSTSLSAHAYDLEPMSTTEIVKEASIVALFVVDYAQTRSIETFCDNRTNCHMKETNWIMGPHPNKPTVIGYFVGASVLHAAAVYIMPKAWREVVQDGTIGLELVVIGNNKRLGLSMKF
jgi:hypothetical protein